MFSERQVPPRTYNPVLWQEFTHQTRSASRFIRTINYLGPLLVALILVGVPLTLTQSDVAAQTSREIALLAIWLVHAAVAVRCIVAGANAVSREHVGQTWESLILTGVSARRIVFGKWRAAMRRVAPWMLALGVVRLVMLPVFMVSITHRLAYFWHLRGMRSYSSYSSYYDPNLPFTWVGEAALLSVLLAVVLTLLEVSCCVALGLAASAVARRGTAAGVLALSVRFAPVAVFAAFTRYEIGPMSFRWYRFAPFALADGGTSPLYQLIVPLMPWTIGRHAQALGTSLLVALLLGGLLVVALFIALAAIRRTGAMPHQAAILPSSGFRLKTES